MKKNKKKNKDNKKKRKNKRLFIYNIYPDCKSDKATSSDDGCDCASRCGGSICGGGG